MGNLAYAVPIALLLAAPYAELLRLYQEAGVENREGASPRGGRVPG